MRIDPDAVSVAPRAGETLLAASLRAGIAHTSVCGGNGRCSTCRVLIVSSRGPCPAANETERAVAARLGFGPMVRLACQIPAMEGLVARRLVIDEEDRALADAPAGDERDLAILFCDIRGFTEASERLPAYDVAHILHRFFAGMDAAVRAEGGTIQNTMGDGLLALFGLEPESDPRASARAAVRCAVAMRDSAARLREYTTRLYGWDLRVGIGVHRGVVVVGSFGPPPRRRLTVVGDAVNTASRIEAENRESGTEILVSEAVREAIGDDASLRRIDGVEMKGKRGTFVLYEVRACA